MSTSHKPASRLIASASLFALLTGCITAEAPSTQELAVIDKSRSKIKACIDELKRSGDWIGMPFDFEWAEMLDRLPAVNRLYRRAVAMAEEQLNAPVVAAPPPPPPPAPAKTTGRW